MGTSRLGRAQSRPPQSAIDRVDGRTRSRKREREPPPSFEATDPKHPSQSPSPRRSEKKMRFQLTDQPARISTQCFRLLTLKTEIQNDVEVIKPVLQELEVLRLSCALGMLTSVNAKDFDSEMLDASEFDEDFARFLRQHVFNGRSERDNTQEGAMLTVQSVFGKQAEVMSYLRGIGAWDEDMEDNMMDRDQGIFGVLLRNEEAVETSKKLVVFGWLQDCLLEPQRLRDTATYVLRFLTCLSELVTFCLSKRDAETMVAIVDSMDVEDMDDWKSYSVQFHVERQQDEQDDARAFVAKELALPYIEKMDAITLIKGSFPGLIAVAEAPREKKDIRENREFSNVPAFAQWLVQQSSEFRVVVFGRMWSQEAKRGVLEAADAMPRQELESIQGEFARSVATVDVVAKDEVSAQIQDFRKELKQVASVVFDVDIIKNSEQNIAAIDQVRDWIKKIENHHPHAWDEIEEEVRVTLWLPCRLKHHMKHLLAFHHSDMNDELDAFMEKIIVTRNSDLGEPTEKRGFFEFFESLKKRFTRGSTEEIPEGFRVRMTVPLETMRQAWFAAVDKVLDAYCRDSWSALARNKRSALIKTRDEDSKTAISRALELLFEQWGSNRLAELMSKLTVKVSPMFRCGRVICTLTREAWNPPSKFLRAWKIDIHNGAKYTLLGDCRLVDRKNLLATFSISGRSLLVVSTNSGSTLIERIQFSTDPWSRQHGDLKTVRNLKRRATMCDFNAKERMLGLVDGTGSISLYRFNETYTVMEVARTVDSQSKTSLQLPLTSVLVSDGVLWMTDDFGGMQSVNTRSQQSGRKYQLPKHIDGIWRSSHFPLVDGVAMVSVIACTSENGSASGKLCVVSTEDHREIPQSQSPSLKFASTSQLSAQAFDEAILIADVAAWKLSIVRIDVTIQSDSYRIRTVGDSGTGRHGGEPLDENKLSSHWLWALYHLYEKFPVRGLLFSDCMRQVGSHGLTLRLACPSSLGLKEEQVMEAGQCFLGGVMQSLAKLNKPLYGMNCTKGLQVAIGDKCAKSLSEFSPPLTTVLSFLQNLVTFVPIQVCRAEFNALTVMTDGEDKAKDVISDRECKVQSVDIARSIRFGLLSPLLESWHGKVIVLTSMGKQSTGKSYYLNHLTGTSFAIAGARCTDGAWMSVRILPNDVMLVVLDFEGLGSFERTEQEDVFLSVLNASVSMLTVFRMEMRFDKEIDDLFSKFQKGCQLLKSGPNLFRGKLFMSVKDVNPNDQRGVVDEFQAKFGKLLHVNKERSFLTEMYRGQLDVNCSPPLGTVGYYRSLKHAQEHVAKELCGSTHTGFTSGKAFYDCVRLVLAKISILDWTSLDESALQFRLAEISTKLPTLIRYGCLAGGDKTANTGEIDKDDLINAATGTKIVVTSGDVFCAFPELATRWYANGDHVNLDTIEDGAIDLMVDWNQVESVRTAAVASSISQLFHNYLQQRGHATRTKLSVELQKEFDLFLSFVIRRRRMRIQQWAESILGSRIPDAWKAMEQQHLGLLQSMFVRCLDKCEHCRLGCMRSAGHSIADDHDCGTSHQCSGRCDYCDTSLQGAKTPYCMKEGGHEGKCECSQDHTCGKACRLSGAMNCDHKCSFRAGHEGVHLCSVSFHKCGQQCSAHNCQSRCVLDMDKQHTAHKCDIDRCLEVCVIEGCERLCGEADHFHGQVDVKVALCTEELSKGQQTFDASSQVPVVHMCKEGHTCGALCEEDGICQVNVFLKQSSKTFKGARGTFQYTFQEMNGSRKKCVKALASGQQTHSGKHSCISDDEGEENDHSVKHYCDVRCPCCSYYCQKQHGHEGMHSTTHGNMRNTMFVSEDVDIDLQGRMYKAGERGTAEMCNLYCSKMGREHVHYVDCIQSSQDQCVYSGGSEEQRRHCTKALEPKPDHEMDEVLHEKFWDTLGWEDPCASAQERTEFAKCGYKCDAPDHDGKDPSFCVLPAWHKPEPKPRTGYDGFSYVEGHKFECSHAANGGQMHHVLILDCSGSMQGWPWDKLVAAVREYIINRVNDGASLDLVSIVTFDNYAQIECEATNITLMTNCNIHYRGGGTTYSAGLRTANEVLSRVQFDAYKPVVVFFSDGQPFDPQQGEQVASHIAHAYGKYGLQAFAVGFGTINLNVLERIAHNLGGTYYHALSGAELKTTFYSISASLGSRAGLALTKPQHEGTCVICCKDLTTESTIVLKPCMHELHENCFNTLKAQTAEGDQAQCPTCRRVVQGQ